MTTSHGGVRKRSMEQFSSAQVIASNDDLLTELLLRLPIKSLLKFKCVCRHWISLVSDPHFIHRRGLDSKAVSALCVQCTSRNYQAYYEFVPLQNDPLARLEHLNSADSLRSIRIEHSCKGLFLCSGVQADKYFVYNPTTNQFKNLPPLPLPVVPTGRMGPGWLVWGINLAFDPSKSHSYKVLCMLGVDPDPDNCGQILLYSSETGCWRVSVAPFNPDLYVAFRRGVLFNGAIHWCPEQNDDASLYFDLDEEVIREMPMPPLEVRTFDGPLRYFGESGGHLHLVESYKHLKIHLAVYEMEPDRSGWFLKFRVDPDVLAGFTMPYEHVHLRSVLHVDRGEQEEDSFMVVRISNNKVIQYNFMTQTHREIHDMDSQPKFVFPSAFLYIESLALV